MPERVVVGGLPAGGSEPLIAEAVRWGDVLYLSGHAAVDQATMRPTSDDFEEQARFVLDSVVRVLRAGGSGPEHALRVVCYLARRDDFGAWNELWKEYFPAPRPARTTMVADFALAGLLIEVEVTAGVPG